MRAAKGTVELCSCDSAAAARALLGVRLFSEVALSRDGTVSCAACHSPSHAFAEPRTRSNGIGKDARRRNTPSLINAGIHRATFNLGRTRPRPRRSTKGGYSPRQVTWALTLSRQWLGFELDPI